VKTLEIEDLIQMESLHVLCGEMLGEGSTRSVYKNEFDAKLVVKVAKSRAGIRANIEEFNTWESVQFVNGVNSYFARVHSMSQFGSVLVQEYAPNIPAGKYKIPSFFTDLKADNFGLVVGAKKSQVVCRDYGVNLLREKGMKINLINFNVA
jgi:hypothetical protein